MKTSEKQTNNQTKPAEARTNKILDILKTWGIVFAPRSHSWELGTVTTVPSLLFVLYVLLITDIKKTVRKNTWYGSHFFILYWRLQHTINHTSLAISCNNLLMTFYELIPGQWSTGRIETLEVIRVNWYMSKKAIRPILSYLVPLIQNESLCKTFLMIIGTYFHINGLIAWRLTLKQRQKTTLKWPNTPTRARTQIARCESATCSLSSPLELGVRFSQQLILTTP